MAQSGDIDLGQRAFATERSAYRCEGISFDCTPPNACVRDLDTLRPYCCDYDGACWTYQATCSKAGDDSSAADAQNQQCVNNNGDGDGEVTWCCENGRERCDQSKNYFCLSTARNPLRDIGGAALNATYDSLRDDDNTELDSLSFDPSTLVASATHASETTPSLVPAITTMASSRDGGSDTPAPQPPSNGDSGGVSAGTIAGAAVGAGIAVVLLALGFWLIRWRRRRRRRTGGGPQQSQLPPPRPPQGTYSSSAGTEIYHDRQQGSSLTNPSELHGTDQSVGELPAVIPQEMPANWR